MDAQEFAQAVEAKRAEAMGQSPPEAPESETEAPDEAEPVSEEEEIPSEEEPTETEEEAREAAAEALGEEATEEEREAAREEASEFYVRRYKTREEAERAYEEKDATIDRLHQERAVLLRQMEERQAAEDAAPQELDLPAWQEWAAEAVEEGEGASGALAALSNGGYPGYEIYLRAWMGADDPDTRGEALSFNNQLMLEVSEMRAQRVVAEQASRAPEPSAQAQAAEAREWVMRARPDLADYEDAMNEILDEMAEGDTVRNYLKALAAAGVEGKARALDHLYLEAKARGQGKTKEAKRAESERRITSSQDAKVAASVSSAEATPARTPRTEAERFAIARKNELREHWGLDKLDE